MLQIKNIEKPLSLIGGVYQQYKISIKHDSYFYLNLWTAGCCGFNTLSYCLQLQRLDQRQFDELFQDLTSLFKERNTEYFYNKGVTAPCYPVNQLFFLYGDVEYQKDSFSKLIAKGKEVHRYRSGSEPYHDTVMISIDL